MTKKERICKEYGLIPPKIAESDTVSLGHGLCGSGGATPFAIRMLAKIHSLLALTIIDPSTGWFEIVEDTNKSETSTKDLFPNTYLVRYPRPQFIVFDNWIVGEFKREFKKICVQDNYGNEAKTTTSHNPQANAIIK
jgi:hypothetical protein